MEHTHHIAEEDLQIEMIVDGAKVTGKRLQIAVFDAKEKKRFRIGVPLALIKFLIRFVCLFQKDLRKKIGGVRVEKLIRIAIDELRREGPQTLVDISQGDGTTVLIRII